MNKETQVEENIYIGLGKWDDYHEGPQQSGSYIFRPINYEYWALPYTVAIPTKFTYTKGMSVNGKYVQGQMTFHFGIKGEQIVDQAKQALFHVSLDNDFPGVIRAEIDIDSLPI